MSFHDWTLERNLRKSFYETLYSDIDFDDLKTLNPITFVKRHMFKKTAEEIRDFVKSLPESDYRIYKSCTTVCDEYEIIHKSGDIEFIATIYEDEARFTVCTVKSEESYGYCTFTEAYIIKRKEQFAECLESIANKYPEVAKDFGKATEPEKTDVEDDSSDEIEF